MTSPAPPPDGAGSMREHRVTQYGLRVGRLAGVPVYLGRTWPVIVVIIVATFGPTLQNARPDLGARAYVVAIVFALLLLVSVLAHEAAHALVGRALGYQVSRVVADLWGGHTAYDSTDTTAGSSALVSVAGPVANAALALIGWGIQPQLTGEVTSLLGTAFVWTNGFVALFNLLPGLPLDGGYLVDALVWKVTGSREQGMIAAGWCGRAVTMGVIVWVVVVPLLRGERPSLFTIIWGGFIGAFLWAGATQAIKMGRARKVLQGITVGSVWRPAASVPVRASAAQARTAWQRLPAHSALVVTGADGSALGLVDGPALQGIPDTLLESTGVDAVMHRQPAGWVLQGEATDTITEVVVTMQELGIGTIAVCSPGGRVQGVVLAADL